MEELVKFFKDVTGITRWQKEQVRQLRDQRNELITTFGGPPLREPTAFNPVFELAMEEAEIRGYDYDLCVVPETTYKRLNDISATVPTPGKHRGNLPDVISEYDMNRLDDMAPPILYTAGDYSIEMTYAKNIEEAILLDMSKL